MRRNDLYPILWFVLIGIGLAVILRYLWPLIIALVLVVAVLGAKRRAEQKNLEAAQRQSVQDLEAQMFQEQSSRQKNTSAEVVDAEFEPVARKKEERELHESHR